MSNWHGPEVPEEIRRGQPKCYQVYHHRDRPCEDCHVLKVFATGQPQKIEKINHLDGRIREFSVFPILDESGQVIMVVEHVRDITERHLAEQALKESEADPADSHRGQPGIFVFAGYPGGDFGGQPRGGPEASGKAWKRSSETDLHGMLPPEVSKKRCSILCRRWSPPASRRPF